jgi:hypothetical protein
MLDLDNWEILFVAWAFMFHIDLIMFFALRKWAFPVAIKYGWIVYASALIAPVVSIVLLLNGKPWFLWLGGFLHLVWAMYGFVVEYILHMQWRTPMNWSIGGPYVLLYLATIMFYWWPLGTLSRPLWYAYAALFVASTFLNMTSHKAREVS